MKCVKALLGDKEKRTIFFALMVSIAAVVWFVAKICLYETLEWAFSQSEYWLGILELAAVFFLLLAAQWFAPKKWQRVFLTAAIVLIFSYLHSFFFAFFAGAAYAAVLWMTGYLLCFLLARSWRNELPACLMMGMAGMIVLVCVCSLLKFGTPSNLRTVYKVLVPAELILCGKKLVLTARAFFTEKPREKRNGRLLTAVLISGILTSFLLQLGRACISLDYDSLWYGLRSDTMLAPFTGIYDRVISTGCVYVYPKGIEALSLAFNLPSTYSFVYAVNLMFTAFVLFLVWKIAGLLCKKENTALFAALCCAVTPGIMNMAVTAKSDISTLLIQLISVYYSVYAVQKKNGGGIVLAAAASVLSLGFKPTSFVFTPLLLVPALVIAVWKRIRIPAKDLWLLTVPLGAVILLFLRTYWLTGLPVTSFLTGLLERIGFSYRFPYSRAASSRGKAIQGLFQDPSLLAERFVRLAKYLFCPTGEDLSHVIIAWPGLLFTLTWFATVASALIHGKRTRKRMAEDPCYALVFWMTALLSAVSFGCVLYMRQPDGNYFMLMYALIFVAAALELQEKSAAAERKSCIVAAPLLLSGAMMCLLSSWAWTVGLTPVSLENRGFYHHDGENLAYYEAMGVEEIASKLKEEGGKCRVIAISDDIPRILTVPAIIDSWEDLTEWGNTTLFETADGVYDYFTAAEMDYVLLKKSYAAEEKTVAPVISELTDNGYLQLVMEEGEYLLLRFVPDGAESDIALTGPLEEP